jgi:hypothetical protein
MSKAYAKTLKAVVLALFAASLALFVVDSRAFAEKKRSSGKAAVARASDDERATASVLTHAQYLTRVREAAEAIEDLAAAHEQLSRGEKGEWERDPHVLDIADELPSKEKVALERARALISQRERVESSGGSIEVNNSWLQASLDESSKTGSRESRAAALRFISQRLRALEARLAEAEGPEASAQDKDAERGRLNAILRDPEFNKPPRGNALQRIAEEIRDWFGRHSPRIGGGPAPSPRLSMLAQVIVITLCVLVLAYVARRFWTNRARDVKSLKLKRRPRVILGERLEPDATPSDLLAAAEGLARAGDLRGAIRKAYVALLCGLGDGGVIRLAQHKTNRDYLDAVRRSDSKRLYSEVLPLTRGFEQHWYGLRDATADDWDDYKARCRQALRQSGA